MKNSMNVKQKKLKTSFYLHEKWKGTNVLRRKKKHVEIEKYFLGME